GAKAEFLVARVERRQRHLALGPGPQSLAVRPPRRPVELQHEEDLAPALAHRARVVARGRRTEAQFDHLLAPQPRRRAVAVRPRPAVGPFVALDGRLGAPLQPQRQPGVLAVPDALGPQLALA